MAATIGAAVASSGIEAALRRDRWIVAAGLAGITAAGWAYLFYDSSANHCARMAEMALPHMAGWTWVEFTLTLAMWSIMMVAMMAPSAAPVVLLFAGLERRRRAEQRPFAPTAVFISGYLAVWTCFSLLATSVQWGLQRTGMLSSAMQLTHQIPAGVILVTAGVFQWTRWKQACLTHCRTPLDFVMTEWREGTRGAFVMGWRHGLYCTGCCWALMLLLFATGVMNLAWVAALSALVLAEKVLPGARWVVRTAGVGMAAVGIWLIVR